jgi:hypothetical protein
MAQTRKRRRTKHRGNAAGMVEARGRTGRKPTADERKNDATSDAARKRQERLDRPPSWRRAINNAAIGAIFLFVLSIFLLDQTVAQAATLVPFLFLIYVPLGYWTDSFIYKRRQAKKATAKP